MIHNRKMRIKRHRSYLLFTTAFAVAFSTYIDQVLCFPTDASSQWPSFPRRNIAALARDGYLKSFGGYKRSISTLAKNGQLPTFRSPYDETDKHEQDENQEKRNVASLARLRSFAGIKRNIQALARDGYLGGKGQYSPQNDKRNVAALARNGGRLHKKDDPNEDEYYYPFYQNSLPPLSEVDGPYDFNELYDLQQSINPDLLPPLSQVFKRGVYGAIPSSEYQYYNQMDLDDSWYPKRGAAGMPVHGLYRPVYVDTNGRSKRYIMSIPDEIDNNDVHNIPDNTDSSNEDKRSVDEDVRESFEKRHIGSLARLGLLPSFRFSGGRYSRSGRARLLWPSQDLYRQHSLDENLGIREYISGAEAEPAVDTDDADVPAAAVPAHSHPTGRILHRPLNNDLPHVPVTVPQPPPITATNYVDAITKNNWKPQTKETPKFYYFRSLKIPYHTSGKRYLLLPAVDNILLRKNYPNSSLPSRRKNQ